MLAIHRGVPHLGLAFNPACLLLCGLQARAIASAKGAFFINAEMDPSLFFLNASAHPVALGVLQYGSDLGPVLKKLPKPYNLLLSKEEVRAIDYISTGVSE